MEHGKCIMLPGHSGTPEVIMEVFKHFELITIGCESGFWNDAFSSHEWGLFSCRIYSQA